MGPASARRRLSTRHLNPKPRRSPAEAERRFRAGLAVAVDVSEQLAEVWKTFQVSAASQAETSRRFQSRATPEAENSAPQHFLCPRTREKIFFISRKDEASQAFLLNFFSRQQLPAWCTDREVGEAKRTSS